jgi:glycosyltransferase involved in cell wall biosynthesis
VTEGDPNIDRSVRVALFTTYYPRHERDHAGLFVSDLVEEVRARGIEVDVVSPGVYNDYGLAYGVGVARNVKRRPWRLPLMLLSALRALRRAARNADVVHVHWLLAAPLGLLSGKPWVLTLQGTPTAGRFQDLVLLRKARWLVGPVLRRADAVICVSQRLTDAVNALGANAVFIPNGTRVPEHVGDEADPPEILYAGRMVEEKGIRELAIAAEGMNLVVAGDGPLRHLLPQSMGLQPHNELEKLYDRAAIQVIPSYAEGLPVVCIEAMAHGRPVVGTDVAGISELIVDGETGFLVPPRDPVALRGALLKLLSNKELRRRMGLAGRERIADMCGWDRVAPDTIGIYQRAAGEGRPSFARNRLWGRRAR